MLTKKSTFLFLFCSISFWILGCRQAESTQEKFDTPATFQKEAETFKATPKKDKIRQSSSEIPSKVYKVLDYVRLHDNAPAGYTGGRKFGNFEKRLPIRDGDSNLMKYREWDVNPNKQGKNRGAERLITSGDRRAWYTRDHYESFIEIK